jgi:transcriptional regulator with XRE-family HTH domain
VHKTPCGEEITEVASQNSDDRCAQTIGEIIKSLRVTSGMTPEQLGDSAQLSPSYIRKLEGGVRHDITLDTAKKLADGLGVSPEVFFDAEIAKPSTLLVPAANPQAARQLLQWAGSIQAGIGSLLEEDERLCLLSDAASEAIVVLDEGTVLFVNRALIDMLGVGGDPDQLMGFNALDVNGLMKYIAPGSVAEAHRLATTLVDSGELPPNPLMLDLLCSGGAHLTVWVRGKIMEYRGRTVYVVILRDSSWEKAGEALGNSQ